VDTEGFLMLMMYWSCLKISSSLFEKVEEEEMQEQRHDESGHSQDESLSAAQASSLIVLRQALNLCLEMQCQSADLRSALLLTAQRVLNPSQRIEGGGREL
jgi:hypothetical protein